MHGLHLPDDEAVPVPGRQTGPLATEAEQPPAATRLPHKRQRPILFPQLPPLQFDDHAVYLSPEEIEDDALYPVTPPAPVSGADAACDPLAGAAATLPDTEPPELPAAPVDPLPAADEPALAPPARRAVPVRLLLSMSLVCLLSLAASLLLTLGAPEATVTLLPDSRLLSTSLVVTARPHPQGQDVAARLLSASSATKQARGATTGQGYQPPQAAHGWLTFYNAAPYAQTVGAGTTLTGADGVLIVTDAPAPLPAAAPPVEGAVTVPAHALTAGPQGNIGALALNGLCCLPGVSVKNATAFVGGQAARHFLTVAQADIQQIATPLLGDLSQQAQAALLQQMRPNGIDPKKWRPKSGSLAPG